MNIKTFVALALLQQNNASVEKNMQNCNTCKKRPSTNGFSSCSLSAKYRYLVCNCFCVSNQNHNFKDMYTNKHSTSDNANCCTNASTTKLPTEKLLRMTEQPINYHYHSDTSSACERCQHKQCPQKTESAKHREQQKNVSGKTILKNPQEIQKACEQPLDLSMKGIKDQRPNIAKTKVCISNLSSANTDTCNTHKKTDEPIHRANDKCKIKCNKKRVAAKSTQNKHSKCLILQNEYDTLHSRHRSNHLKSADIHLSEKQEEYLKQIPSESVGSATCNFESSKMAYKSFALSFFSFTKYRISESSNTNGKNTVEGNTCAIPPELMGRQELPDLDTQQHVNFVSECKIEWHDKSENICRNKWLIDQLNDYEKNKKMIFRFIADIDVIDVDYKLIQALYLAFIAYECFEYNVELECHILKNKLWGIHNFVNEFYFHIMWELETLNSVTINNCDDDLEYKMHILNEIQQIDEILCLYDEICSVEKGSLSYNKKLGKICYEINEFRNETQTYLERFHTADRMTIFYSLVNTMTNRGFQETKTSMSMDDSTAGNDSIDSANSGNTIMRKPKKIRSLSNYTTGKISYKYYQLLGNVNLTKKSTYMYAFTTDFDSLAPFKFGLGDIKMLRSNKGNKISASITLFGRIIAISANQKVFKSAVVDVLDFIKITKTRDVRFTGKAMDERNACMQLSEQNDTTPLSINFSIRNVRRELIRCRDVILKAMGI